MKFSLRAALAGLWLLILVLCLALAVLMRGLFEQGVGAQLSQGTQKIDRAGQEAARRFERYRATFKGRPPPLNDPQVRTDLQTMLSVALADYPGVEGGFWSGPETSLGYAFPTHDSGAPKKDLPRTELPQIKELVQASLTARAPRDRRFDGNRASLLLHAQPLPGPPPNLAVWTMTRAPLDVGESYQRLTLGLGVLLLLALGSGLWLLRLLRRWTKHIGRLENAIASTPLEELPPLPATGERELDRIVVAFNQLNGRLRTSREEGARLGRDLARADRLAAVGRMAAGLTHEIGNPLAAMRLRAENAIGADHERAQTALRAVLGQIGRLEELLGALRLLTRTGEIRSQPVALVPYLREQLEAVRPQATKSGITLALEPAPPEDARWNFDEKSVARALGNLLLNAIQHTSLGGRITLGAEVSEECCRFRVADSGAGVAAAESERIFEPFVTGRAEGMGLGLSLVREIAEAHGGKAICLTSPVTPETRGAVFILEIPRWQKS
ncbi:MAG: HAMP domain-containing histidine kinase [Chthoniobacterales bacterium]|nr:HAMP domain-containing histidine kinase [Chthoniobacterales bacterium]